MLTAAGEGDKLSSKVQAWCSD